MTNCPVCGGVLHSMTCTCGYDRSRDYMAYPTLAPLPADLPTAAVRTGHKQAPRQAMVTCPECGKATLLQEQTRDYRYRCPSCPHCAKPVLLDPTDRFNIHAAVFLMLLTERKPWGMYSCAEECMDTFQYGDPEKARRLADTLSAVAEDPGKYGLELREDLRETFAHYAARAHRMLEEHHVGKLIFDA